MISGRGEGATTMRESEEAAYGEGESLVGCISAASEGFYSSDIDNPDVAPAVSEWVAACFPQSCPASERDLRDRGRRLGEERVRFKLGGGVG